MPENGANIHYIHTYIQLKPKNVMVVNLLLF